MAKKIMMIDDEIDLTQMLDQRLTASGYDVKVLNSSNVALEEIKEYQPDLILLDIMMPYKDGYLVRDEIKSDEETQHIPIIFMTAKQSESELMKDSETFHKVEDFIIKPFGAQFLLSKIGQVFKRLESS